MNRGVHGVGADGAFEQLVYARRGGEACGRGGAAVGLRGLGKGGVLLIHLVDRRHTLDAIRSHSSGGEGFSRSHLLSPLSDLGVEKRDTKGKGAPLKGDGQQGRRVR